MRQFIETWHYNWAYQSEELTFAADPVPDTDSTLPLPLQNKGF